MRESFTKKFDLENLAVRSGEYWTLSIRPGQVTLGSMLVSCNRDRTAFSELTEAEGAELAITLGLAEQFAKAELGAERINVYGLMMNDPLVHLHLFPRYAKPVERYGSVWSDADWPGPVHVRPASTTDAVLGALRQEAESFVAVLSTR